MTHPSLISAKLSSSSDKFHRRGFSAGGSQPELSANITCYVNRAFILVCMIKSLRSADNLLLFPLNYPVARVSHDTIYNGSSSLLVCLAIAYKRHHMLAILFLKRLADSRVIKLISAVSQHTFVMLISICDKIFGKTLNS